MTTGKQVLSTLFGSQEIAVVNAISGASGLTARAASILLPMAAPVVIGFLNRLVRDRGLNLSGLATLLQRESGTFRSALPAGLNELFWSGTGTMGTASPVVAQAVQKETTSNWVLPALAVAALALGLIWAFSHLHGPAARVGSVTVGEANRLATPAPKTVCTLPASINLPANGVASRLLAFVQNPDAKPEAITWFNADQLSFDTGSATLRPESKAQLSNIAVILTNCPSVRLSIAGYTDSIGSAPLNLRLSQNRADTVVAHLAGDGVSQDRLSAEGYGEEYPIADNDTAEGRARNRRVAIRVTDK
jgi:outer membrane protein OmpA-like peptidoglycan-associated protein